MVGNIVNVVGEHSEEGRWREPFRSEVHGLGFREARNLIQETAVREHVFLPDRVDLFTNKIRSYRTGTTVTPGNVVTTQSVLQGHPPVLQSQPLVSLQGPPPVMLQGSPVQQTTSVSHGFKFNYLPVDKPFEPDVFASRHGEHGTHHGHHY